MGSSVLFREARYKVMKELIVSVKVLQDEDDGPLAEIAASPAKLIEFARDVRNPRRLNGGGSSSVVMMVAGTGFGRCRTRLLLVSDHPRLGKTRI